MSSGVAVLTSLLISLGALITVLNPITENGLLMRSQATVRDCSMLGIAMYYIRDILYNCSGYNRFRIKPSYPLLIRRIAGWHGVFAISNYNSRGVWLKIWGNKVTRRHFAIRDDFFQLFNWVLKIFSECFMMQKEKVKNNILKGGIDGFSYFSLIFKHVVFRIITVVWSPL